MRDVILSRSAERLWPEQPSCVPDVAFDKQEAIQPGAKNPCISAQEKCIDPSLRSEFVTLLIFRVFSTPNLLVCSVDVLRFQ
jgi:hypothetical protein